MDQKIKNWLGIAAIAALVVGSLAAVRYVGVYADTVAPSATFQATGEGKATAVPDVAEFSFGVTTEGGKDVAALQKENTNKSNEIIAYIKSAGIASKDIRTESYNISPRYQYFSCNSTSSITPCKPSEIIGYTVSQTVHVKVRDFGKTGDLLSGAASKGANNISGLTFKVDDPENVKNEARGKAIQNAKTKAEALAKAGGFRIGRIISIQESGSNPVPYYYTSKAMDLGGRGAGEAAPSPAIEPGSDETTINIALTYEIR